MTERVPPTNLNFLSGGGRMGERMRAHDWSASPLGSPETWPQALRSAVSLMLGSKFPMFVAWGPELGFLYNDAYAEILGAKHPAALGRRFHDIWAEIWADISPLIDQGHGGRGDLGGEPAARDEPVRLRGEDQLHLLLLAGAGRRGRCQRHVLRLHGDDRPR